MLERVSPHPVLLIFYERLPRMSAPLFSQKGRSFVILGIIQKKFYNRANLACSATFLSFVNSGVLHTILNIRHFILLLLLLLLLFN